MSIVEVEIWYRFREQDDIQKHTFEIDRSWYRDEEHMESVIEEDLDDFAPNDVYEKGWKISEQSES